MWANIVARFALHTSTSLDKAVKTAPIIVVGLPAGLSSAPHHSGLTFGELATIHEFGLGVPERSFIRATLAMNRGKYGQMLVNATAKYLKDGSTTPMHMVGNVILGDIRERITGGILPNITEASAKSRKVPTSDSTPLMDTGQLVGALTYVLVHPNGTTEAAS